MATLIPAIGTRHARKTGREKRLAQRLGPKLEDGHRLFTSFCNGEQSLLNAA